MCTESLLAVTEAATDREHTKIRRDHPLSGCLGGYFSIEGRNGGCYLTCSACPSGSLLVSQKAAMRTVSPSMQ